MKDLSVTFSKLRKGETILVQKEGSEWKGKGAGKA